LGLRTFLTAGEDECRAWTIRAGDTAPQAAGVIHTDFEKGFIKAEAYSIDDLRTYGSGEKSKEGGGGVPPRALFANIPYSVFLRK